MDVEVAVEAGTVRSAAGTLFLKPPPMRPPLRPFDRLAASASKGDPKRRNKIVIIEMATFPILRQTDLTGAGAGAAATLADIITGVATRLRGRGSAEALVASGEEMKALDANPV